ncbi:GDSL-type esterase/lipase family protein [Cyclobacterium sp.]|uniref:SGNH/GDSL hydrolase family protein n=1 Tax=Cyclobacterium sp. TaxID=1966343 RepID=UPI0019CC1032|nr:GDSL-type esterase/lipase family protein [Cyclobacterium sp.]MBD3629282.1 SGNH/GDSL hydrolase family protein [Cyclobacterium sp.]
MNKHFGVILFLLMNFALQDGFAQSQGDSVGVQPNKESIWKGFQRHDFTFLQREARLIVPKNPLYGNPWVWRARFPDWHTEADSILISRGFHLAYINTDNLYGSPGAVAIWNEFYDFLTVKWQLHEKVSLMGVSRGGLFIYNWAKKNPEKVASIYAEAPVSDFKSWPGGFGSGKGSPKDWERLKEAYGFLSDEEAKLYQNNPIDSLGVLAEAKVPLMHMIGLDDKIVPIAENTLPLITKYIGLGGNVRVVTCTRGEQALEGHHFTIETPKTVADFITYHALEHLPLDAANYHTKRDGLKNAQIRFERDKKGKVAFLGGSITHNPGWRDSVSLYLQKRFPETEFEFIEAGIPSMGTTPAAFRLVRDVLSKGKIDLLFEEGAVNDASNGRTSLEQIRAMEGIVRHTLMANPDAAIVIMHFADPDKIESYSKGIEPEVIANHTKVAEHYHIPTINLAKEVADRIAKGEFTWEDDFKDLHPSPFGQGIYAKSINHFLSNAFSSPLDADDKVFSRVLPEKIDTYSFDKGSLVDVEAAKFDKGWYIDPSWNPEDGSGTRPNYVNVPMLRSDIPGSTMKLKFNGSAVGIAVAAGKDAGDIEYRIDKKEWKTLRLFTRWSAGLHLPWYYTLASELSEKKHLLEIRIASTKDEKSTGNACTIRYFYVNKY